MAINTTKVKNNVYKAIEVIAEQRIDNLKLDKTIVGTIDGKVNSVSNEYRVRYNGGILYAYSQNEETYLTNTTVYVSIPENDFTKKKWIVGKVSNTTIDNNVANVSAALSQYNIIGTNLVSTTADAENFKLKSYDPKETINVGTEDNPEYVQETYQDANLLYDASDPENSALKISSDMYSYLKDAIAIQFAADFRTSLSPEHRREATGDYGLIFNLKLKSKNSAYATMEDKWTAIEPRTKSEVQVSSNTGLETVFRSLQYYRDKIEQIIVEGVADTEVSPQELQQRLNTEGLEYLQDFVSQCGVNWDSEAQELAMQYIQHINDILSLTLGPDNNPIDKEGIKNEYDKWFSGDSDSYVERLESYFLNVENMVGNPYNFTNYSNQYIIQNLDIENFVGIDSIYFYCDNFSSNAAKAENWGYDIYVSNIQINLLEELDDSTSDYRLVLEFPQGIVFRSNDSYDIRQVYARIKYQNNEDVTTFSNVMWFKKDDSVKAGSDGYNSYAGAGWKQISGFEAGTVHRDFAASDNKSYQNIYKVVATRNLEVFLQKEFILYNEANKRDLEITSDNGFQFAFSDEDKVLYCEIDNKRSDFDAHYADSNFSFIWKIKDSVLTETYDELVEKITKLQKKEPLTTQLLAEIVEYKRKASALEGVVWEGNKLIFPASQISNDESISIQCTVMLNDGTSTFEVGSANATLSQGTPALLNGYHIEIENGDQVFQYNEAGVSPASERYNNPIEPLALTCKFYNPTGGIINPINYTVKWQWPIANTLLLLDNSSLVEDLTVGQSDTLISSVCPINIKEDYDYAAVHNQIRCVVEFNGDTYSEYTNFFFGKIGDNGTNGTDVVAKISPIDEETNSILNTELLTLNVTDNKWNTGTSLGAAVLKFELFRRNVKVSEGLYKHMSWSIAGVRNTARNMSAVASYLGNTKAVVNYSDLATVNSKTYYTNQIIKGQASLDEDGTEQSYNYFYPIPTMFRESENSYPIGLDRELTMRQVLYNADGRNPLYNKNQGVKLNIQTTEPKIIEWECKGGIEEDTSSALRLTTEKAGKEVYEKITTYYNREEVEESDWINSDFLYVIPSDTYSGEWCNNYIEVSIRDFNTRVLEYIFIVPIHMSLNTYGLASLNAWDGNNIEINEEGQYILAPQIGAGKKEENNTFTGVVMGTAKTYGSEEQVGLLGYYQGEQSIFLDAVDGSATFGLPEVQADANNHYTEGRIHLQPKGESYIGQWRIGSRALYNIAPQEGYIKNEIGSAYTGEYAEGHIVDVPHDRQGILFSADPAYISVKGRQLKKEEIADNANRIIAEGDTFELQLDPNQLSIFTIFRHYLDNNGEWQRTPTVGIDQQGRFYSNALRQKSTSLAIGFVGAFGKTALQEKYIGTSVDTNNKTIWKLFTDYTDGVSDSSTLYLSGGTSENDDYKRPIQIMGNWLALRTNTGAGNMLNLTTNSSYLGRNNTYLQFNSDNSGRLNLSGSFTKTTGTENETINGDKVTSITRSLTKRISGDTSITTKNSEISDSNNVFRLYGKTQSDSGVTPYDLWLSKNGTEDSYLQTRGHRLIFQTNGSQGGGIQSTENPIYETTINEGGSLALSAKNTNYGISLYTTGVESASGWSYSAGLRLMPRKGGDAFFNLYAEGAGHIWTNNDFYHDPNNPVSAVQIDDFIGSGGIYLTDTIKDGSNISVYARNDIEIGSNAGGYKFAESSISATFQNHTRTADGSNLWDLIYDCLYAVAEARQAAENAQNRADDAWNYADNAYTKANNHTHNVDVTDLVTGWTATPYRIDSADASVPRATTLIGAYGDGIVATDIERSTKTFTTYGPN